MAPFLILGLKILIAAILELLAELFPVKVKFDNGLYGIRKGFFSRTYLDFSSTSSRMFLPKSSAYFLRDCQVTFDILRNRCDNSKIRPRPRDSKVIGFCKKGN